MLPKNIKYHRKERYPQVRNNYRKYKNAKWNWEDILKETEILKNENTINYLKIIAEKYNIPYGTLKDKFTKYNKKSLDIIQFHNENRGGYNKIFSENEEKNLYEYIKTVFIDCNLTFNNEHLRLLAIQYYHLLKKEINKDYVEDVKFTISNGWVNDYKKRWKLSSLKTKLNKKSTKIEPKELIDFMNICSKINQTIPHKFIFNLDETFWRIVNGYYSTIGLTNSDHRKVDTQIDPKSGFTVIFIISAEGNFLKPIIILKGKTKRCLTKIDKINDNDIHKFYSNSGWINIEILIFILNDIHKITQGAKCALIMDKYSIHTDDIIRKTADNLNIELVYVPTGKTSTNQPLDVGINGPVKSIGKSISNNIFIKDPFAEYTLENSINSLIQATKKIKKETIINCFNIACNIDNKQKN
jgi:hypothetical protein